MGPRLLCCARRLGKLTSSPRPSIEGERPTRLRADVPLGAPSRARSSAAARRGKVTHFLHQAPVAGAFQTVAWMALRGCSSPKRQGLRCPGAGPTACGPLCMPRSASRGPACARRREERTSTAAGRHDDAPEPSGRPRPGFLGAIKERRPLIWGARNQVPDAYRLASRTLSSAAIG